MGGGDFPTCKPVPQPEEDGLRRQHRRILPIRNQLRHDFTGHLPDLRVLRRKCFYYVARKLYKHRRLQLIAGEKGPLLNSWRPV